MEQEDCQARLAVYELGGACYCAFSFVDGSRGKQWRLSLIIPRCESQEQWAALPQQCESTRADWHDKFDGWDKEYLIGYKRGAGEAE